MNKQADWSLHQSYGACLNVIGWLHGITCKQRLTSHNLHQKELAHNPIYHSLSIWKMSSHNPWVSSYLQSKILLYNNPSLFQHVTLSFQRFLPSFKIYSSNACVTYTPLSTASRHKKSFTMHTFNICIPSIFRLYICNSFPSHSCPETYWISL